MELEIWKDIEGFENKYQISSLGNVRSVDRIDSIGRFKKSKNRKISTEKDGYKYITLISDNSKTRSFFIHRLVANAFIARRSEELQVNHIDGDKSNNKSSNLEWISASDNARHALRLGLRKSGENHANAKLNNNQVIEIPRLIKLGYSQKKISKLYNVSYSTIKNICQKRKWIYLDSNNPED